MEKLPLTEDVQIGKLTLQVKASAMLDEKGDFEGIVLEIINVTRAGKISNEREKAMDELRITVEELDQFAYVASHDLRSPLQGMDLLTQWILDDDGEALSEESRMNMARLQKKCRKLSRILDDLLEYSRSGKVLGDIKLVDANQLIHELDELLNPTGKFSIKVTPNNSLPFFKTYKAPFEMILRNLINNSIKHHDLESGNIEISSEEFETEYVFTILDDGPGIPEQHHEKIFAMFKSFGKVEDKNSSGIGLALIKKTVESFGCEVKVKHRPPPDRGISFSFTWPKQVHD